MRVSTRLQCWLNNAIYKALNNGHEDIASLLYGVYPNYPIRIRGKVFVYLIRYGTIDMIQFVYRKQRAATTVSNRAFKIAAACGRLEVLTFLLKNADIALATLEHTFKSAIRAKKFDIAALLYATDRIDVMVLYKEFENAMSIDASQFLFETGLIPEKVVNNVFKKAVDMCIFDARVSHVKIIKYLSTKTSVSIKSIETALLKGAANDSVLLVKALFTECYPFPEMATELFVVAMQHDSISVVNFLWGQPWIPYEKFVEVFHDAAITGCLKTVMWFCKHNRASREATTAAFLAAAEAGHDRVSKILFDKTIFSKSNVKLLRKHDDVED